MTALALVVGAADVAGAGWVDGLELVAVPVVAARRARDAPHARTRRRAARARGVAALVALGVGGFAGQAVALALGRDRGGRLPSRRPSGAGLGLPGPDGAACVALACLGTLGALLLGLPALRDATGSQAVALVDAMVRSGSLVFGGGHVVLPLLDQARRRARLGRAAGVPRRLRARAGDARAAVHVLGLPRGDRGPRAERGRRRLARARRDLPAVVPPARRSSAVVVARPHGPVVQAALVGVGAAVVGLLAAAFWDPVLTASIDGVGDAAFALGLLVLLRLLPIWAVVPLAAAPGALLL